MNASEPPPNNPYMTTDGIMGASELPASFCIMSNNTCEPSSLFLDLLHRADEESFSVYVPPFIPPGVSLHGSTSTQGDVFRIQNPILESARANTTHDVI